MWITVTKGKGGAACTVTVLELAYALTQQGLRVAVLDLDHQAAATAALEPVSASPGMRSVLDPRRPTPLPDALVETRWPGILLAPAERKLANRDRDMTPDSVATLRRARHAAALAGIADVVLIDTPRELGRVTAAGYLGGETAIITARPTVWNAQGAEEARYSAALIAAKGNPELRMHGVLMADVDQTDESQRVQQVMRDHFCGTIGVIEQVIPHDSRIREAIESYHIPAREYGITEIAEAYEEVAKGLLSPTLAAKK